MHPITNQCCESRLRFGIDGCEWLVGDENGTSSQTGHGQEYALTHSRTEFMRIMTHDIGFQTDAAQSGIGRGFLVLRRSSTSSGATTQLPADCSIRIKA